MNNNNMSRNGTTIATLPLKDKIECHRKNLNQSNENIKRKKRLKAMAAKKEFNLDNKKMSARLELAEKAIEAREINNLLAISNGVDNSIYCCKTGLIIGEINPQAMAFVNQLKMPFDIETGLTAWQSRHAVHPAWLNTSSEVLVQLQRIMPHEYCIYTYTYLIEQHSESLHKTLIKLTDVMATNDTYTTKETKTTTISSIPATFKNHLLKQLYTAPLNIIVEIAELLRIFASLMGKNKAVVTAMPNLIGLNILNFRDELLSFIRTALQTVQKKHHANDTDRARLITMADLHQITANDGMRLFREAKISLEDDNLILADVSDLFRTAGLTSTLVAKDYSQVKYLFEDKIKTPKYSKKVIKSKIITTKNSTKLTPITL